MAIHVWRYPRGEENKDEPDRDGDLHQVWHHDGMIETNEADERFRDWVEWPDKGHRALRSVLELVHDVVAACCRGLAVQLGEGRAWVKIASVLTHVNLKIIFKGMIIKAAITNYRATVKAESFCNVRPFWLYLKYRSHRYVLPRR